MNYRHFFAADSFLPRISQWLFLAWIFFLPWQARSIISPGYINGGPWEYGTVSIYASEIILWTLFVFSLTQLLFSQGSQRKVGDYWRKHQVLALCLAGMLAVAMISVYWSTNSAVSLHALWRFAEIILLLFLLPFIPFSRGKVVWCLVLSGVVVALLGHYQVFQQGVVANKWLGMAGQDPVTAGAAVIESLTMRWLRLYGTLPHPNMTGALLGLSLLGAVFLWLQKSRKRLWLIMAIIILASGLVLTFSRAAYLAFAAAFIVLALFFLKQGSKNEQKERRILLGEVIFLILCVAALWTALLPDVMSTRFQAAGRLETRSLEERASGYGDFRRIFAGHWAQGVGIGAYTVALHDQVDAKRDSYDYQPIHNIYLLIAAELGIFGIIFFLTILVQLFRSQKKDRALLAAGVVFILICGLFDHYWWTSYWGMSTWWIIWIYFVA